MVISKENLKKVAVYKGPGPIDPFYLSGLDLFLNNVLSNPEGPILAGSNCC